MFNANETSAVNSTALSIIDVPFVDSAPLLNYGFRPRYTREGGRGGSERLDGWVEDLMVRETGAVEEWRKWIVNRMIIPRGCVHGWVGGWLGGQK